MRTKKRQPEKKKDGKDYWDSMDTREFETSFKVEEKYWWFVGQNQLVQKFLKQFYSQNKTYSFLDVGCGTGITLSLLSQYGKAQGIDIAEEAIYFCRKRGFTIKKSDVMDIQFPDNSFDAVTVLGVFYHKGVTYDMKGFQEAYRILKPNGRIFFLDCAMPSLYGKHDIAFHGIRRYTKKELRQKLEKAGLTVERISYYNMLLFPIVYVKRKLEKLSSAPPKSEVSENINPILNKILTKIYCTELSLLKYFNFPVGVNILAVARKQ